jgi:hypothetical protein
MLSSFFCAIDTEDIHRTQLVHINRRNYFKHASFLWTPHSVHWSAPRYIVSLLISMNSSKIGMSLNVNSGLCCKTFDVRVDHMHSSPQICKPFIKQISFVIDHTSVPVTTLDIIFSGNPIGCSRVVHRSGRMYLGTSVSSFNSDLSHQFHGRHYRPPIKYVCVFPLLSKEVRGFLFASKSTAHCILFFKWRRNIRVWFSFHYSMTIHSSGCNSKARRDYQGTPRC